MDLASCFALCLLKEEYRCVQMLLSWSFWEQTHNVFFQGNLQRNGPLQTLSKLPGMSLAESFNHKSFD